MPATTFNTPENNISSLVVGTLAAGGVTLDITPGEGAGFPAVFPYHLTLGGTEIVRVTNKVTDALTIVRAQEGTADVQHNATETVRLNITAQHITDLNAAVNTLEALIPAGSGNDNTLRWTGTVWAESAALKNDGTDVTLTSSLNIGSGNPGDLLTITTSSPGARTTAIKIETISSTTASDITIDQRVAASDTITGRIGHIVESDGTRSTYFSTFDGTLTEKLRIKGNGNVGIGIDPDVKLHVFEASATAFLELESGTENAYMLINSGTDGVAEESMIRFQANGSNKWDIGLDANNDFRVFDYTRSAIAFKIVDNGDMSLMQGGGDVILPTADLLITAGDVQIAADAEMRFDGATGNGKIIYESVDGDLELYADSAIQVPTADVIIDQGLLTVTSSNIQATAGDIKAIGNTKGFIGGVDASVRGRMKTFSDGTAPGVYIAQTPDGTEYALFLNNAGVLMRSDADALPATNLDGTPVAGEIGKSSLWLNVPSGAVAGGSSEDLALTEDTWTQVINFVNIGMEDPSGFVTASLATDKITINTAGDGDYFFHAEISAASSVSNEIIAYGIAVDKGTPIVMTSSTDVTPPVILTASAHGLETGDSVILSGHATNISVNGQHFVTFVDATHFSIQTFAGVNVTTTGGGIGTGGIIATEIHGQSIKLRKHGTNHDVGFISIGGGDSLVETDTVYLVAAGLSGAVGNAEFMSVDYGIEKE